MAVGMYETPVQAVARISQVLKEGLFEVTLPNGKKSLGHLSKDLAADPPTLTEGMQVRVELTPFDFDSARIAEVLAPSPNP